MSWRRASTARRSSTTRRRRPAPSTSGSLRGPVILDVIVRALRARGVPTTLLYGVDDLDPMDAQALLTPDAVDRYMGAPLAHIPDQAGDGHASYARHHAQTFIDIFAGLGIHPDRYYWMSDIYPTGEMDRSSGPRWTGPAIVRDIYRRVANVQHPDTWLPDQRRLPELRQGGHDVRHRLGRRDRRGRLQARPRDVGARLRLDRAGRARSRARRSCPGTSNGPRSGRCSGVTIEPCGKDLSTRGGSRDRSDAIAREVFEREPPLNFPYEFLNIGGKKMSTSKGLGAAAHTMAEVAARRSRSGSCSCGTARRASSSSCPRARTRSRACSTSSTGWRGATAGYEVKGELPSRLASRSSAYSLLDPEADVAAEAERVPAGVRASRAARADPGRGRRRAGRGGEGGPLDGARARDPRRAPGRRSARWLDGYAPRAGDHRASRRRCPAEADALDAEQRAYLRRSRTP